MFGTLDNKFSEIEKCDDITLQLCLCDEIEKELNTIGEDIKKYLEILSTRQVLDDIIENEVLKID